MKGVRTGIARSALGVFDLTSGNTALMELFYAAGLNNWLSRVPKNH